MAIHFSNGIVTLFDKDTDMPIVQINYHLSETDATQYTNRKWWGEFQSNKKLKESRLVGTPGLNLTIALTVNVLSG